MKYFLLILLSVMGMNSLAIKAQSSNGEGDDLFLARLDQTLSAIDVNIYEVVESKLETYENGNLLAVAKVSNQNMARINQNILKLGMYVNKISKQMLMDPGTEASLSSDYSLNHSITAVNEKGLNLLRLKQKLLDNHAHIFLSYRILSLTSIDVNQKCNLKTRSLAHRRIIEQLHPLASSNGYSSPAIQLALEKMGEEDPLNDPGKDPCLLISGPTRQEMEDIIDDRVQSRTRVKLVERVQVFNDIVAPIAEKLTEMLQAIEALEIASLFGDVKELQKNLANAHVNYLMMRDDLLKLEERLTFVKEKVDILKADPTNLDIFRDFKTLLKDEIGDEVKGFFFLFTEGGDCTMTDVYNQYLFETPLTEKEALLIDLQGKLQNCFSKKILKMEELLAQLDGLSAGNKSKSFGKQLGQATFYMRKQ